MNELKKVPDQHQVAADFDRVAGDYEDKINAAIAFGGSDHQFYIDVKRELILDLTRSAFGTTDHLAVLDLGCGLGAYHPGLEGQFGSLHGTDVSAESLRLAAQKHQQVQYSCYDGSTLPYRDEAFDVVFCVCVMHHVPVPQWSGFVREVGRVLKQGGLALIFEHNPYNPATQYIVRTCDIDKDAVLLRAGFLRNLFRGAGFESVETRSILTIPPKTPMLKRVDRFLGRVMLGAQYYLLARRPIRSRSGV